MTGCYTFPGRDKPAQASLWWAESLLSVYWANLATQMWNENRDRGFPIGKGSIALTPKHPTGDIKGTGFFDLESRFLKYGPNYTRNYVLPVTNETNSLPFVIEHATWPNVWVAADTLGKVFHSAMLTDLGQASSDPNIFKDPELLQHLTANFSKVISPAEHHLMKVVGPARQDYSSLKATTGPLEIHPSVISGSYHCQVPRLRQAGAFMLLVVSSSLDYLSVLWHIFTFIVHRFAERRDKSQYCQCCLRSPDDVEAQPRDCHRHGLQVQRTIQDATDAGTQARSSSDLAHGEQIELDKRESTRRLIPTRSWSY